MAEIIIMPKLGFNMDEGQLVKWNKKVGDNVEKGQVLFEIQTDKTTMPIESTLNGIVREIFVQEGETVPVTTPVAIIAAADEDITGLVDGQDSKVAPKETAAAVETVEISGGFDFDVAVIGAGPGGYVAAIKAAQNGKKTCIFEEKYFGGVCLNEGCIPTKTLLKTLGVLSEVKEAEKFGILGLDASKAIVDMVKLQDRKKAVVNQLTSGVKGLLKGNGVTIYESSVAFKDAHTLKADKETITAKNIIIASGSEVLQLPIEIKGKANVITSREVLEMTVLPKTMVIIGGGVIGTEFGFLFAGLGVEVTMIELMDRILPMVDEEVTAEVVKLLESKGVKLITGAKVQSVNGNEVSYTINDKLGKVNGDTVIMAAGRKPRTEGLNLQEIGVLMDGKAIKVDEKLRTNFENIYAIGDVNGKVMLAHTASAEAMVAVDVICAKDASMDYKYIPSCIYLQPEIASVGLTESQAREKYKNVKVGKFPLAANGKALVEGETAGLVKVILDGVYGEIIGVHIFGVHATDMIGEIVVAMNLESTADEIINAIHPRPTVSEAIPEAFAGAYGKAIHWHK